MYCIIFLRLRYRVVHDLNIWNIHTLNTIITSLQTCHKLVFLVFRHLCAA